MKIKTLLTVLSITLSVSSCINKTEEKKEETNSTTVIQPHFKKEDFINHIQSLKDKMRSSERLDSATAAAAIKAYADFAFNFADDSSAADCLFKAAEIASAIGRYQQAIIYYQTIQSKYPDFKLAAESLYLQGYIYDNFVDNEVLAKEIYEKVIVRYPKHKLAEDAKYAVQNLGKSDEELIQEFKKKNKIKH